ncbi:uncharacterized protein LOC121052853 [Rosa chinensis]|uniref:uncharacterized protein LOC121052853 n=1 Tax=Rosa chinensis TaxID=74649 RepID=UPI001AD8EAAE|nr:uncharacterized protein LOC121052853 [Rosa chinensis]
MSRVLVDTGALVSVIFRDAYKALNRGRAKLSQDSEPLISFSGDIIQPLRSDYLSITIGESPNCSTIKTEFIVVDCVSSYNAILGRPALWRLKTFIAGHMLMMKVPTPAGTATIRGDQAAARKCYSLTVSRGKGKSEMLHVATNPLTDKYEDLRDDTDSDERPSAVEDIEEVVLSEQFPDRTVKIGTRLSPVVREGLISFLRSNTSAFAWSYEDMPGIPTEIATHNLSIVPYSTPVRQKRRAFTHDKYRAIQVEVKKLMAIKFVREVTYPRWLANVVMVPKKSPGSWRMCVDYTNLNRACPKDSFPLPRIDQLIDSTAGYRLLSFMDAFSGYNQIRMNAADEEHTAFTTDKGLYCYQVYVDDMLVKSLTPEDHVTNLSIVFTIILRNGMRLNPQKCIFGVEVGKFLWYIISHRGIEANPEKHVEVIAWTAEHKAAFLGLKAYLSEVPLLYKPVPGELLYIYLAASSTAVSSVLIRKDSDCEYPVYYAGKGYTGAESRYPDIEKVALALLVSARKLRHYFQAHSITVFTNHPLRQVLQKPETSGRLIKWAIELGEFDIKYQPRTAIKGQAAVDFISESIPPHNLPLESPEPLAADPPPPGTWQLYVDGASNKKTSGAGIMLISPDDQVYEYALKFAFKASNNAAEYEALIAGLQIARELGVQHLSIFNDSQLVVNQVCGNFEAKEPHMSSYQALARALVQRFTSYIFTQIPRAENDKADALAKLASNSPSPTYGATKVEILERPSTSKTVSEIFTVDHTASWMDPILKYMVDGQAPDDKVEARRLQLRSARYTIMNGKLYRRGHCFPNLKCVTPEEGHKVMKDIHAGALFNVYAIDASEEDTHLKEEVSNLSGQVKYLHGEKAKLEKQRDSLKAEMAAAKQRIAELEGEVSEAREEVKNAQDSKKRATESAVSWKEKADHLEDRLPVERHEVVEEYKSSEALIAMLAAAQDKAVIMKFKEWVAAGYLDEAKFRRGLLEKKKKDREAAAKSGVGGSQSTGGERL